MRVVLSLTVACAVVAAAACPAFAQTPAPSTATPAPPAQRPTSPAASPVAAPSVAAPSGAAPAYPPANVYPQPYPYPYPYPYPPPGYPAPAYPYPYPPPGYAYPPPAYPIAPPPPPLPLTSFSLTISPIHALMPLLELSAEFRVGQQVGIAAIGGIGSVKASTGDRFSAYEAGGQFRYYVTGNFRRGVHLGTELLYLYVSGNIGTVSGMGDGLAMGPLLGWKTTLEGGFTFEVQGGIEFLTIGAEATDGSTTQTGSASQVIPLLNLNIGYSI